MNKKLYLDNLDAVRDVIEQLPNDVSICRVYDEFENNLRIQIGYHADMVADRVERSPDGFLWAEKDYHGGMGENHATVIVGWVIHEEDEDDDL